MDTRKISIADYDYPLPDERIAKFPVTPRDHSKLLVYRQGQIADDRFYNLPQYLPSGALMVFNNTKVIRARLHFHKDTGAHIEVFLLEPYAPADYEQMFVARGRCQWLCMIGNLKKWKEGVLTAPLNPPEGGRNGDDCPLIPPSGGQRGAPMTVKALRGAMVGTSHVVTFEWDADITFAELLEATGELPIPPYLNRDTQQSDLTTYQTVYSKVKGSVAAPTAGLHFTPDVLQALDRHGIERDEVTLHVGAGTFKPVKSQHMGEHEMHTEHVSVQRSTLEHLLAHRCEAIAVGTTSVRTLESLYYMGLHPDVHHVSQWEPYDLPSATMSATREQVCNSIEALLTWMNRHAVDVLNATTQIIIAPGYEFKIVRHLVTNFHQPQSTLLLLVSAFTKDRWRHIYRHALDNGYRFLSYGDSSLLSADQ